MSWQIVTLIALGLSLVGLTIATRSKQFPVVASGFAILLGAQALLFVALRALDPNGIAWLVPVIAVVLLIYNAARWFLQRRSGVPDEPADEEADDVSWLSADHSGDSDAD
jgi:hypothetical protein